MKVALVFPPLADPTQPYSSLPTLAAFLRREGRCEVLQLDANIEFVRAALTGESVRSAGARIAEVLARPGRRPRAGSRRAVEYARLVGASLKAPLVARGIDAAVEDLRSPAAFRDLERLSRGKRLVDEAMEVLSAASQPLGLSLSSPSVPDLASPREIAAWAADEERNPFRAFLAGITLPRLEQAAPGAIGISITYPSQVLPAVTLALLIRDRLPGIPVVFGGSMTSRWYDRVEDCPEIFDWCRYLVPFEGESALAALLAALESGGGLEAVPNLVYREGGRIQRNPLAFEAIDALPTPDYRGLPLDLYFAPRTVFLLATSRGCYWQRCSFCSVSPATRRRYRVRHPDLIHEDIATLSRRHDATCISFADDCVAPATLKALASRLLQRGPKVSWQCEARFEKALTTDLLRDLAKAGCRNLIFGLESHSPRVLALMKKGVRHEQIDRILADCRRFGIAFNLQFFFGFPGETPEEAEATAAFAEEHMRGSATFSFGTFELQKGAEVEKDPGSFGIERVDRSRGPLATKFDYFPRPAHAADAKDRLRRKLVARTRHRHTGISINAHTLIFLHESGVAGLAENYRLAPDLEEVRVPPGRLMARPLAASPNQHTGEFAHSPTTLLEGSPGNKRGGTILVYDHDLDRIVEVSRLARWLLHHLDGTATPLQLVERLAAEAGADEASVSAAVETILAQLYERGFVAAPVDV